jgi:hypothetical protein
VFGGYIHRGISGFGNPRGSVRWCCFRSIGTEIAGPHCPQHHSSHGTSDESVGLELDHKKSAEYDTCGWTLLASTCHPSTTEMEAEDQELQSSPSSRGNLRSACVSGHPDPEEDPGLSWLGSGSCTASSPIAFRHTQK